MLRKEKFVPSKKKRLLRDCPTRWGSSYDMILRAHKLQKVIEELCIQTVDPAMRDIIPEKEPTAAEWEHLEEMKRFLKPFKMASVNVEGQKYATIHQVLVLYNYLMDYLDKRKAKYANHIFSTAAKEASEKLKKYYNESSEVLTVATVLDPTLKTKWHEYPHLKKAGALPKTKQAAAVATAGPSDSGTAPPSESGGTSTEVSKRKEKEKNSGHESLMKVKRELQKQYNNYRHLSANNDRPKKKKAKGKGKRKRKGKDKGQEKRKKRRKSTPVARERVAETQEGLLPADELAHYLEQKTFRAPDKFNICHWWRAYELQSLALAAMARDILAIQATSAPSERAFSFARQVVTEFRASLAPKTIRAILCLKTWLGCREVEEEDSEGEEEDPTAKGKGKEAEEEDESDTDEDSDSEGETSRVLGSDSEDSSEAEDDDEEDDEVETGEKEDEDDREEGSNDTA